MLQLYTPKEYVLYVVQPIGAPMPGVEVPLPKADDGHAGPGETSQLLALRPVLVNRELVPTDGEGRALNRLQALREASVQTGIW